MNPIDITIEQKDTTYKVKATYHSDSMCQNYDVDFTAIEHNDGRITFLPRIDSPKTKYPFLEWPQDEEAFSFLHSDPDRIIALSSMMKSFAEMVKKENKKSIDLDSNE